MARKLATRVIGVTDTMVKENNWFNGAMHMCGSDFSFAC